MFKPKDDEDLRVEINRILSMYFGEEVTNAVISCTYEVANNWKEHYRRKLGNSASDVILRLWKVS